MEREKMLAQTTERDSRLREVLKAQRWSQGRIGEVLGKQRQRPLNVE